MKINHLMTSALALSLFLSCNGDKRGKGQPSLMDATKQELATAVEEREQLLAFVKEISLGMSQVKKLENIVVLSAGRAEESDKQKTQILSDIASVRKLLRQRKEQLQALEESLQQSTGYSRELQDAIEALRGQIDSLLAEIELLRLQLSKANKRIGTLNDAVDSLNMAVSTAEGERNAALEASEQLENELNTCFYVVASKSELKEHSILESGFLRKTKLLKGDFDQGFFVISDKRLLDTLPLGARKVEILTSHPEASFELLERQGEKLLRIVHSEQFWSLSNYLVVQKD